MDRKSHDELIVSQITAYKLLVHGDAALPSNHPSEFGQ